jgi:TetR/AcrR family transcriptional repressor of mexJK operon
VIAETQTPGRRQRSERKKTAILDAAEALFVTEGYERTTVDVIAARAQVSKRTAYDHFGDKETIFLRTLERVNDALAANIRSAIDEELTLGRDLREALTAFGHRIVVRTFTSSDYLTFRQLVAQQRSVPRLTETVRDRPEQMLEERFAALAADGALRAPDAALAVRHFTALTIGLALDAVVGRPGAAGLPTIDSIIADGVDAFLRAYR